MKFKELSDKQWEFISRHLPPPAGTGRPRADDRNTINGILYVLTTGCRWMDMPKRYGDDSTAHRRLDRWQRNGTWKKILDAARSAAYKGAIKMQKTSVDSTDVAAKKGATRLVTMETRRF
ncbi:MAG: IS5 family transposase [Candidatus Nitrosotenuis sp.]